MEGLLETVYAAHNFEAENDDELTFKVGETVIVMQKDDGFNDGWWKVYYFCMKIIIIFIRS
jgi:hypothetical protein